MRDDPISSRKSTVVEVERGWDLLDELGSLPTRIIAFGAFAETTSEAGSFLVVVRSIIRS